jgi:hypothetical protein
MRFARSAALLLLGALGCNDDVTPPASAAGAAAELIQPDDRHARAERAARIAQEVLENPDEGAAVLERHEVSPEEFSDMMYEVAGDPELAEVYETVRG